MPVACLLFTVADLAAVRGAVARLAEAAYGSLAARPARVAADHDTVARLLAAMDDSLAAAGKRG